jgi:hypothetical protein
MENQDFDAMMRRKKDMELKRQKVKAQASKDRLVDKVEKRIKTSFIGALDSVETHLSCLWETNGSDMSPAQVEMYDIYQKIRKEILDKGNQQVREFKGDLENFDVNFKQYQLELDFKGEENE